MLDEMPCAQKRDKTLKLVLFKWGKQSSREQITSMSFEWRNQRNGQDKSHMVAMSLSLPHAIAS